MKSLQFEPTNALRLHNNITTQQLLHVSDLICPSSRSTQLYKTFA